MVTIKILLWLFATIPVGLFLTWLGWRGRRINRVPACRQCAFDLTGVWPASSTCPECGAGLKQPKMVVTGQRRRMWYLIVPGGLGVALPSASLAFALFLTLAGKDVYKYKPVSLLLWEGRNASPEFAKAAAKELTERMLESKLADAEVDLAVNQALDIQGNVEKPWADEWGDLIDRARLDGALSAEQKRLYRKQAAVLELVTRPRVRLGDPVPIVVRVKESRVGAQTNFQLAFQVSSVKYASEDVSLPMWNEPLPGKAKKGFFDFLDGPPQPATMPMGYGYLAGTGSASRQWQPSSTTVQSLHRLRPSDGLGKHSIAVECLSSTSQTSTNGRSSYPTKIKKEDARTRSDAWTTSFELVAADQEAVEIVPETEALRKQMLECLTISQVVGNTQGQTKGSNNPMWIQMNMTYSEPKVPLAMEAFARIDGKEVRLGDFTTSAVRSDQIYYSGTGNQRQQWFNAQYTGKLPDQIDIVFRPKKELAVSTPDLTSIYGGELVYEKVPVQKNDYGSQGGAVGGFLGYFFGL